jgi:four helix bundle protein
MSDEKEYDLRKRSYAFSVQLVKFLRRLQQAKGFYSLIDQTLRSGTSVGANIIEAKAASSTKDYIRFYQISLKSGNEAQYWLALLRDTGEAEAKDIDPLLKEAKELSNILGACLRTLRNKKKERE